MRTHRSETPIDVQEEFSLPADRVWLNASHQGPLPGRAAEAVSRMVAWKQQPHNLSSPEPFSTVPKQLRSELGRLLSVPPSQIALANSSSYGLHVIANGLDLGQGDEVIVAKNDFPSDILPWLRLQESGVNVKQLTPKGQVLSADEIAEHISTDTAVVCLTWVHSFSGHMIDIDAIGQICRDVGALFVVNGSQGVGAIPIQPSAHPVDALVSVGFKYLCGPYGTGTCWLAPRTLDRLTTQKMYWLSALTADDLADEHLELDTLEAPSTASRHDVFGTANFFNFAAWFESIRLILDTGIGRIYEHNLSLASRLEHGLDRSRYEIQHRGEAGRLSSILFLRPIGRTLEEAAQSFANAKVDVARRRGMLRLAPHFYNTVDEIDRALAVLNHS